MKRLLYFGFGLELTSTEAMLIRWSFISLIVAAVASIPFLIKDQQSNNQARQAFSDAQKADILLVIMVIPAVISALLFLAFIGSIFITTYKD